MTKNYTLDRSNSTGWWVWECKDGSAGGSAPTKGDARDEAKAACGMANFDIMPPLVNAVVYRGYLSNFTVENLDGKQVTFSVEEISQAEFSFFFGLPCAKEEKIDDTRKAITILKIWGICRGGLNVEKIKKLHYLSDEDFNKLINRKYFGLKITIQNDGRIIWKFPD